MVSAVVFAGIILIGAIASAIAFKSKKYAIKQNKEFLRHYALAILILSIGFVVHSSGDFFSAVTYNYKSIELPLESIAHVILFISFLLFVKAANSILKTSKQFWFS